MGYQRRVHGEFFSDHKFENIIKMPEPGFPEDWKTIETAVGSNF